jgi:4-hydroxybenzoate polyprenyltransferase
MAHQMATALAVAATTGHTFHIGPWIIVPLLLLAAVIVTPIYVVRDRRRRRSGDGAGRG